MGRPKKIVSEIDQPALIDVEPENMKVILRNARAYLKTKEQCGELNEDAKRKLNKLRDSIKEAEIQPLEGNVYRFRCGKHIIEMVPQSEKVKIKAANSGEADDDEDGEGDEE